MTLYPPVKQNLSYYKKLLKNIPIRSGEEYQHFLNETSLNETSQDGDTGPRNSTQTENGRGQSFWRRFSFTRKSYRVNPPANSRRDLELGEILPRNEPLASGNSSNQTPPSSELDNTIVNK